MPDHQPRSSVDGPGNVHAPHRGHQRLLILKANKPAMKPMVDAAMTALMNIGYPNLLGRSPANSRPIQPTQPEQRPPDRDISSPDERVRERCAAAPRLFRPIILRSTPTAAMHVRE